MKISNLMPIINVAFNYVAKFSKIYNIDESHALKHSMETFRFANEIYNKELQTNAYLSDQQDVIYASAILHDMCDKKYMIEKIGLSIMKNHMGDVMPITRLDTVSTIISTISYSKVKQNGYPNLGEYQLAYHIVREADLLAAYDIDRTIMYGMMMEKLSYCDAVTRAIRLFDQRILKYREDNLFTTDVSKDLSSKLHEKAIHEIKELKTTFCT